MKNLILLSCLLGCIIPCQAQQEQYHPYKEFGSDIKVLTLSNGKYDEFFDTDTIAIVGSAVLNTKTMKVIGLVEQDTMYSEATMEPEVVSRWLSPDPLARKNSGSSPYNAFANNPLYYVDPDGRDTLVMHLSKKSERLTRGNTAIHVVNFSIIRKGVEEQLLPEETYYMLSNSSYDDIDDNDLANKPYYKLTYDKLSHHQDWENTIRVTQDGVFIHEGMSEWWMKGCKILTTDLVEMEPGVPIPFTTREWSIQALQDVRDLYDANKKTLTGDKFVLKTNSLGPVKDELEQMPIIKPTEINGNTPSSSNTQETE